MGTYFYCWPSCPGEYMLNVKNKRMNSLKEEIECSKGHLLYLIDVHIFSKEDINLNTTTLAWPQKIKPVFEQNTEIVEVALDDQQETV